MNTDAVTQQKNWNGKPYHSLDHMLRERFGEKVYKVTLNGGMSCPNRDLINRLNRIEGQIRGIKGMVEGAINNINSDNYVLEILSLCNLFSCMV